MSQFCLSVIIPTFNRCQQLRNCLSALSRQDYPIEGYEVIVVDDGSTNGTEGVICEHFPFALNYLKQENRGATDARNKGALASRGETLVFIDDDVTISSSTLKVLEEVCSNHTKTIALGRIIPSNSLCNSVFGNLMVSLSLSSSQEDDGEVSFIECNTELLAVRRSAFFELEMFQDHTGGWPNWDDVDFGYRAYCNGFRFYRAGQSSGEHCDYALASLAVSCDRIYRASKSAVRLFEQYPKLRSYLPMFRDMTAIDRTQDSMPLIVRKTMRRLASGDPVLKSMELIARIMERRCPSPMILYPLYRWIIGGYICRGYRRGLRDYARALGADGIC